MFSIDYLDTNNLRRKEISKILLEENFIVKTFSSENGFFSNTENLKLISIVDLKTFESLKNKLVNYKEKNKIFIIINQQLSSIIVDLKKHEINNFILLPLKRIHDLTKTIFESAQKIGLITDKKNKLSLVLNKVNTALSKCSCIEAHELDTIKKDLNLILNLLKQYEESRYKFSGSLKSFPLYEVLKFIQHFFTKGVLSINSESIKAEIIISGESIINCISKEQFDTLKTFEFLSSLENGTFTFSEHFLKNYSVDKSLIKYNLNSLIELSYKTYKWSKLNKNKLPSNALKLRLISKNISDNKFNSKEIELLAGIIEHSTVKDILTYNNLNLIDTYETLINLRKKGFVEVLI